MALGTANSLVQDLVEKNWIELAQEGIKMRYRLTSAGFAEKLRLLRLNLEERLNDYVALREQISAKLDTLNDVQRKVVFYGAGDMAQIAYVAIANSPFELVGVIDDRKAGQQFFEHCIAHPSQLERGRLSGEAFDVVIVASHTHAAETAENLRRTSFPSSRVLSLFN